MARNKLFINSWNRTILLCIYISVAVHNLSDHLLSWNSILETKVSEKIKHVLYSTQFIC
jgi:hypothetical protein